MEGKFHEGQLVWAKVENHLWWPAIVDSVEENNVSEFDEEPDFQGVITVNLIGENTYAHLNSKKIVDYQEAYQTHSNVEDEKLKNCITIANKLLAKELDITNLEEINTNLIAFLHKNHPPKEEHIEPRSLDTSDEELKRIVKEINKHLDSKIALNERSTDLSGLCSSSDTTRYKLEELLRLLATFIDHEDSSTHYLPVQELCDNLSFIVQIIPDSSILEGSKILKTLKTFKNKEKESSSSLLKFLSHICHKLYLFWKKSLINASIKNLVTSNKQQIKKDESWGSRSFVAQTIPEPKKGLTEEDLRKFNMMNSLNTNNQETMWRYKSGLATTPIQSNISPRAEKRQKTASYADSQRPSITSDNLITRNSSPPGETRASLEQSLVNRLVDMSPEENKRLDTETDTASQIGDVLLAIRKRELKREDLARLREGVELPESLVDCYLSILKHTNSLRIRYTPGTPRVMIASSSVSKMIFIKGKEISQPEPKIFKHDFLIFPINVGYWTLLIVDLKRIVVRYCDPMKEHKSISMLIGKLARFIQKAAPRDIPKLNTNYQFVTTPVPDINRGDTGIYICNEVENLACGKQNIINRETGDVYRKSMLLSLVKASGAGV
ncbi:unnamed protein product [Blepharisma stoltei]|uniref:PWWP domain-containing protein n=1 Tax=Blepharisma stoltei TaxID=1481888 RepID=A0AAU9K4X4_9CILI|nr:unnamed protein product [Blepharisma stoltei]